MCSDNSLINKNTRNQHLRDILILLSAALILGIYLIATTVVISRDGTDYIRNAKWMHEDLAEILARRNAGFEFLIYFCHDLYYGMTSDGSIQGWIWVAQGISLSCRVFAIVGLYLIGCLLTNRKSSFWGCLILLLLPEPAHWGCDVLREWPYLLFMALTVLSVLYGIRYNKVWPLVLTGIFAGIGFWIRLEALGLLSLGLFSLLLLVQRSGEGIRLRTVTGIFLLIAGFAGPVLIYANFSGQLTTKYFKHYTDLLMHGGSSSNESNVALTEGDDTIDMDKPKPDVTQFSSEEPKQPIKTAPETVDAPSLSTFTYELFKDAGELLVWFYFPFWIIGSATCFRNKGDPFFKWLIGALVLLVVGMILMRYWRKEPVISARWVFPIIAITACYIYTGIKQTIQWFLHQKKSNEREVKKWSLVLATIGILICVPKLLRPIGSDKELYHDVADWITANTDPDDIFYTDEPRIPFYSEREIVHAHDQISNLLEEGQYIITKTDQPDIELSENAVLQVQFMENDEGILIYRQGKP